MISYVSRLLRVARCSGIPKKMNRVYKIVNYHFNRHFRRKKRIFLFWINVTASPSFWDSLALHIIGGSKKRRIGFTKSQLKLHAAVFLPKTKLHSRFSLSVLKLPRPIPAASAIDFFRASFELRIVGSSKKRHVRFTLLTTSLHWPSHPKKKKFTMFLLPRYSHFHLHDWFFAFWGSFELRSTRGSEKRWIGFNYC